MDVFEQRNLHGLHLPNRFAAGAGQCALVDYDERQMLDPTKLRIHSVDESDKMRMLSKVQSIGATSDMLPKELLQSLRKLSPQIGREFSEKGGIIEKFKFRLIKESYGDDRSYVALSYRWKGDIATVASASRALHDPDQATIPIPTDLASFQATLGERLSTSEGLWVDKLCVDQMNEEEMAVAIGCMDIVFRNARLTVIVLEDIRLDHDEEEFMRRYSQTYNEYPWGRGSHLNNNLDNAFLLDTPIFFGITSKILGSDYFSRAWCGHELRVATNRVFMVPSNFERTANGTTIYLRFSSHFFHHFLTLLQEIADTSKIPHFGRMRRLSTIFRKESAIMQQLQRDSDMDTAFPEMRLATNASVVENFLAIYSLKASGSQLLMEDLRAFSGNRDKLSIMINLTGYDLMQNAIPADQLPKLTNNEICRRILLIALASRDPVVLCTDAGHIHTESIRSWLSWPRASDSPRTRSWLSGKKIPLAPEFEISNIVRGRVELVKLDLTFLNMAYPPLQPSDAVRENLASFFDHWHATWPQEPPRVPYLTTKWTDYTSWRSMILDTLAAVAVCGKNWIINFAQERELHGCFQIQYQLDWLFQDDFSLNPWVLEDDAYRKKATMTMFHFLAYPLEHSLTLPDGTDSYRWKPVVWQSTNGSSLLTYAPREAEESALAVPTSLLAADFHRLGRCWSLTRPSIQGASPSAWILQGKHQLYGPSASGLALTGSFEQKSKASAQEVFPRPETDRDRMELLNAIVRDVDTTIS